MNKKTDAVPQITTKQHIIPRKSIARFANSQGLVLINYKDGGPPDNKESPNDGFFWRERVWEECLEIEHEKIESSFQSVVNDVCSGKILTLDQNNSDKISAMYALWAARIRVDVRITTGRADKGKPRKPTSIELGLTGPELKGFSDDDKKRLDKAGFVYTNSDHTMPDWMFTRGRMLRDMEKFKLSLSGHRWGVWRADGDKFILPDRCLQYCIFPVSPEYLLVLDDVDKIISKTEIEGINDTLKDSSYEWWISPQP